MNFVDPTGEIVGAAIGVGMGVVAIYTGYKVIKNALEGNKHLNEAEMKNQEYINKLAEGLSEGKIDGEELAGLQKACSISRKKGYKKGIEAALEATSLPGTLGGGPLLTPNK